MCLTLSVCDISKKMGKPRKLVTRNRKKRTTKTLVSDSSLDVEKHLRFFCECHLLLFKVLHCTSAVTARSVFPLYFLNGSVQLGKQLKVCWYSTLICLTPAHFQNAAGWIGSAVQTCITNGKEKKKKKKDTCWLYIATPKHTWARPRCSRMICVWTTEHATTSTSHAHEFF